MKRNQMEQQQIQDISFQMVLHAGNAKQLFIESLREMILGNEDAAAAKYEEGIVALTKAHEYEAAYMARYARGEEDQNVDIFLVHANDHLAMALTMQDICNEFKPLIRTINQLKQTK